jgi:hypothetical protein
MKKKLLLFALGFVFSSSMFAQSYCQVTTAQAYTMDMPGITKFTLNTITRTSDPIECGGVNCNSYVNTGESTDLELGNTYTVEITHTKDAVIFPNVRNNIRVWIDYNNDGDWSDAGEAVVTKNYHAAGTYTATFTVPTTAKVGTTRLRVTAKMSDDGGHTMPTPCDLPADPIGYHGEIEDYEVNITWATSVEDKVEENTVNVFPNPCTDVLNIQSETNFTKVSVKDITGKELLNMDSSDISTIDVSTLTNGVYFLTLSDDNGVVGNSKFVKM